jgi:LPS-assembly protein
VCITAARQEDLGNGHFRASGFVDLRFGESRIQCESLDRFQVKNADGTTSTSIEAQGNVVFIQGEERLAGERLRMDLDKNTGVFENAFGYVQPGVFIEARTIERLDADTYRIRKGTFTSCAQPNPRWSFSARSATLDLDKRLRASAVLFKVKNVPTPIFIPYLVYPISRDQRATGFLFPHFGSSSQRGFNTGGGFFWAMGRSFDQTYYVDRWSRFGWGYGHEFRYALRSPSRGNFRTYLFRRTDGPVPAWEYDLNWNAVQLLPARFRARVRVNLSSTVDFQQRVQEDFDLALRRNRFTSVGLDRSFAFGALRLTGDSRETFFPDGRGGIRVRLNRRLPSATLSSSSLRHKGTGLVLAYDLAGERLAFGDEIDEESFVDPYQRYDVFPRLSRPLAASFLRLTPQVGARYTRYGVTDTDPDRGLEGPPLERRYAEARVEMTGPTFSRVFNTPGNFYSPRFKHEIGPEAAWTYRSKVRAEDFEVIPRFDYNDFILGTNEVNYALVQRFLSKRRGPSGQLETHEFLNWRVGQTYYVDIAQGQNEFDPNYSSAVFGPGGVASHYSPVQSRVRFTPTRRFGSTFDLEYDVNFRQVRSLGLSASSNYERLGFNVGWFRSTRVSEVADERVPFTSAVRGSARLAVSPRHLTLSGSATYDALQKIWRQFSAGLRYDVQCCGFVVEYYRYDYNVRRESGVRWSIELANIGSTASFLGADGGVAGRR